MAVFIRALRGSLLVFSILSLPGTFAHEMMHWLTGFFANAQPCGINLIPSRVGNSYVLGSVSFRNISWYNGWIVGLSPILLLPGAYFIAVLHERLGWSIIDVTLLYLAAQLLMSCIPSTQDIKIAFTKSWWILILLILAAWRYFQEI